MEPSQRRTVTTELIIKLWLMSLTVFTSFYSDFEDFLWVQFYDEKDTTAQLHLPLNQAIVSSDVSKRYYAYIQCMFAKSGKARGAFYDDMAMETGLEAELINVQFGEGAIAFRLKAEQSVHREHLLVLYSVRLLLKAYASLNPGAPLPAENAIEALYQYFEGVMPQTVERFDMYVKDNHAMKAIIRLLLPQPLPRASFTESGTTTGAT